MYLSKPSLFSIIALFLIAGCNDGGPSNPDVQSFHGKIYAFELSAGQIGEAQISETASMRRVVLNVQPGTDLSSITPMIEVSPLASISPDSGETVDFSDNNGVEVYTVTAESGREYEWEVQINVVDSGANEELGAYGTYAIRNIGSDRFMEIAGDLLQNEKYDDGAALVSSEVSVSNLNDTKRWRKWHAIYESTINNTALYTLRNLHSGKLLTVPESASAGTDVMQQSELDDGGRQLWQLRETSVEDVYQIVSNSNDFAITQSLEAGDDTKVTLENVSDTSSAQRWYFNNLQPDSYRDDEVVNFFNRNDGDMGSVAFDQGNSIPLTWGPNAGKVLWITEDAWDGRSLLKNDKFSCNDFFDYNNSVMVQQSADNWNPENTPNLTTSNSAQGRPRQVFDNQPNMDWTWPSTGIEVGKKVYVHAGEGSGLSAKSQAIYVLTQNEGLEWDVERTTPEEMTNTVEINYSTGMVDGGDDFVYAYGSEGKGFGYESYLHVARFPKDDPQNWTYWNGNEWSDQPVLGEDSKIADGLATNSVDYINGQYVYLTLQQGFVCDDDRGKVYMSTSSSPTGPFTNETLVYTIEEHFKGAYARYYTPIVHAEAGNGRDELLITYSLNFGACGQESCGEDGYLDPYYYRVKGVRVPYSKIGL